ncbi:unnamed protein product [Closterium sp. NIES-54]
MTTAAAKSPVRKLSHTLCSSVLADIHKCASKKQTGVSLKYMMAHGSYPTERNLITAAQFLHHELPVRLAHRVTELENLPYGLSDKAPILKVRDWYVDSFKDISQFPAIENAREEMRFTELLDQVRMRHNNVMPTVAMGVSELKRDMVTGSTRQGLDSMPEIHQFLDRFYMSRIGIRMLIGQHVALHKPSPPPHYIGLICTKVSPVEVARNAVDDARSACMRTYGSAPDVHIYGDPDLRFAYVPAHLHQMLFELVKNSLRAVQERFADADHDPPPIRLIVADGMEDVTIKISDEGGGIPRSGLPKIWTYLYTTAHSPIAAANQLHEMPTVMYATPCHPLPPLATASILCFPLPPLATPRHPLPPLATHCHPLPPLATPCHQLPPLATPRHPLPPVATTAWNSCLHLLQLIPVAPLCAPCIVPIINMCGAGRATATGCPSVGLCIHLDSLCLPLVHVAAFVVYVWSRAGYGYGLPISRLYARYFGGDLQVVSMEGYGTDVYLHLNRLRNVQEPLP